MSEEQSLDSGSHAKAAGGSKLSSEVRNRLGRHLRVVYAKLVEEPVPERFFKLLEELEATEKAS